MKYLLISIALLFTSTANADLLESKNNLCKSYSGTAEVIAMARDNGVPQSTLVEVALKGSNLIREASLSLVLTIYHQTYLTKSEVADLSYNLCMRSSSEDLKTLKML